MPQDRTLAARMERRLPVIVVVNLAYLERTDTDETEWTFTDNISGRGARVRSWCSRKNGFKETSEMAYYLLAGKGIYKY